MSPKDTDDFDIDTKLFQIKNIPATFVGWLAIAVIAGYLVYALVSVMRNDHRQIVEAQIKQTAILEQVAQRLNLGCKTQP